MDMPYGFFVGSLGVFSTTKNDGLKLYLCLLF